MNAADFFKILTNLKIFGEYHDGMFNLPGIVYHVRNGSMDVFAFKGKRPVETTPLFRAPFFNVTGSSVCLGSSSLEKPQNPT